MTRKRIFGMKPAVLLGAAAAGLGLGYLYSKRKQPVGAEPIHYTPSGQPLAIFVNQPATQTEEDRVKFLPFLTGGTPGGLPHGQPGPGGDGDGAIPPAPTLTRTAVLSPSYDYNAPDSNAPAADPYLANPSRPAENPIPGAPPAAI